MIVPPTGVRVWLANGYTDMRRGMNGLALQVQEALQRDPHAGDLYVFRGRRGDLVKILWHDGLGLSLYAKRLERGRFIWPSAAPPGFWISLHGTCFDGEPAWARRRCGGHTRHRNGGAGSGHQDDRPALPGSPTPGPGPRQRLRHKDLRRGFAGTEHCSACGA